MLVNTFPGHCSSVFYLALKSQTAKSFQIPRCPKNLPSCHNQVHLSRCRRSPKMCPGELVTTKCIALRSDHQQGRIKYRRVNMFRRSSKLLEVLNETAEIVPQLQKCNAKSCFSFFNFSIFSSVYTENKWYLVICLIQCWCQVDEQTYQGYHHRFCLMEENKAVVIWGISEGIFLEFTNHSLLLSHIAALQYVKCPMYVQTE